jgi:hypothetical protein
MPEPSLPDHEFSPDDGWSHYLHGHEDAVEQAVKKLIHEIVEGLGIRFFEQQSDIDHITDRLKDELHRVADTIIVRKAIAAEFGIDLDAGQFNPKLR